jgi:hypothetical protein
MSQAPSRGDVIERVRAGEDRKAAPEKDDFAQAFGVDDSPAKKAPEKVAKAEPSGGYIPPAPGSRQSLGQSDIFEVVAANKPALVACVAEQKRKDPATSGKLMMRWQIQTNGRTSNVTVMSDEFKGTYIADCITKLIKGMRFPQHKEQGDPTTFPFKF